ncbi:MAG: hypothetical protein ACQEXE_10475 [Bacillota bacterium]
MDKSHEKAQLDRIEEKMDRILHLLESGDLSTSYEQEFDETAKQLSQNRPVNDIYKESSGSLPWEKIR